jgi:glycosyltransferase involved in cell wall biosynthesis
MPENKFAGSLTHRIAKRLFLDKPGREVLGFTLGQIEQIRQIKPDIVIPLNGFWQLLVLKILQPFLGFKIIVIGNSGPGWDERWNLYLHPNTFVATTGPTLSWAQKTCPYTKSVLVPYAVDLSTSSSQLPAPSSLKNLSHPIVLCPAALVPYKRIDLAIKAVAKLSNASLIVLGQGPLETELKKIGQDLLEDRFLLTSCKPEEMPSFYQAADVITLPSAPQENSPMVLIEALAAGKPIVTTDTPRNRWMLQNDAIYTDPENIDNYRDDLKIALTQKPKIHPETLNRFSWSTILKQYIDLFTNLT